MLLLSTISITFSYEDLVTLACPPEYDYQEAYENYKAAFENAKENVLENLSNDTGSAHLVSEELLKVQDTLKEIEKQLGYKRNELDTLAEPNRTNRNTTTITSENGETITTVENETTDEWKDFNQKRDILNGEIISLEETKEKALAEIADSIEYSMSNPDLEKSISDEFYDALQHFLSEENVSTILTSEEATDEIDTKKLSNFERLIRVNNSALLDDSLFPIR